ncbi:hypothetical protein O988_00020 [Pseudogymnoascus sp. VKM F-3808]|nr:hypothetical protein O988_00020 [Pseudogymnoascus sp. VKM F-3808]
MVELILGFAWQQLVFASLVYSLPVGGLIMKLIHGSYFDHLEFSDPPFKDPPPKDPPPKDPPPKDPSLDDP